MHERADGPYQPSAAPGRPNDWPRKALRIARSPRDVRGAPRAGPRAPIAHHGTSATRSSALLRLLRCCKLWKWRRDAAVHDLDPTAGVETDFPTRDHRQDPEPGDPHQLRGGRNRFHLGMYGGRPCQRKRCTRGQLGRCLDLPGHRQHQRRGMENTRFLPQRGPVSQSDAAVPRVATTVHETGSERLATLPGRNKLDGRFCVSLLHRRVWLVRGRPGRRISRRLC